MAIKKVHYAANIEHIYCTVTCPECGRTVTMQMRTPITRKVCPKCNRLTYCFGINPLRGYIQVNVLTIGRNETPTEYAIGPSDIEVIEDTGEEDHE
jgi:hypothetical protein